MKGSPRGTLVFDLDGTLCDTLPDIVLAVNRMRSEFRLPALPPETVRGFIGNGFEPLLRRSLAGSDTPPDEARETFRRTYRDSLNEASCLYPGVYDGICELRRSGFRIALLSNKPEAFCRIILDHFRLSCLFDAVSGGAPGRPPKPDPEPLLSLLEAVGSDPADAWMIGDSGIDVKTGTAAGIRTGFVVWGYGSQGDLPPTRVFRTFAGLADEMLRSGGQKECMV